ncbi:protein CREG1-like [Phymastichus coffea]|uniref:protein CREG1-like n=1 Tax=Phymastichus coffea TaxID=108790 RepID=UPI00273BC84E|nr:protein CREG1-like [Phymastichus coffea]XP_058795558.1 protein CREG1-like [Phymastichus coffea]
MRYTAALFALAWLSLLALTMVSAHLSHGTEDSTDYRQWQEFKEFQEFQAWKRANRERKHFEEAAKKTHWKRHQSRGRVADPPPIDQVALMARYIVHQANWTSVATISSQKETLNYPFVNVISFSDGPLGNGTGIPYLYLTPLDFTAQDVFNDNRATLMMTLAQGNWCHIKDYDPMDPRCARIIMSGKIKAVKEDNPEFTKAQRAIFGRHPWLAHMPKDHHFFFAKLKMSTIAVLDTFGGPKYLTIKDYLNPPNPTSLADYRVRYQNEDERFNI